MKDFKVLQTALKYVEQQRDSTSTDVPVSYTHLDVYKRQKQGLATYFIKKNNTLLVVKKNINAAVFHSTNRH